jgi:hypothetical protein
MNPALAIQMGDRGRSRVAAQFTVNKEAAGINTVYATALQN